jgi:hypothetical protein
MKANTQAISIDADPGKVFCLLADIRNLPRWAVGFAKSVREQDGRWFVATTNGEMPLRIEADECRGVIDFRMTVAPDVEALAASRVMPRGRGSEYVFTQFQGPGMSAAMFEKNIKAVQHELQVLKAIAEVECPL